ncbi:MAG: dehydrogenase [Actinomycetia bacterium]|nr:dehydrogenase [Actinomycetes bacterium]
MSALTVREPQLALEPRLLSRTSCAAPLPALSRAREREHLLAEIEASGLTGRGGGGFPTATKLRAVALGRSPIVVANGTEGEPASSKDKVLIAANPHLVIDGAVTAARLVGATDVVIAAGRADGRGIAALEHAVAERRGFDQGIALGVVAAPDRFVAGEEKALVNWLNGGQAKPTVDRPFERGVRGRPTLVQNVETLANLALIARHGADWFRELGTPQEPGSALVTVRGAVRAPGVAEIELGTTLRDVLAGFGGLTAIPQAFLLGGYFGTWVSARDALDLPFTNESLRPLGASLGARLVIALPQDACGLAETARVVRYLGRESAGQCGSCYFGLPAIATAFEMLAGGTADAPQALERLSRLVPQVEGRGACSLPTGATRLVTSALRVFAHEVDGHRAGRCCAPRRPAVLPVPDLHEHEWS